MPQVIDAGDQVIVESVHVLDESEELDLDVATLEQICQNCNERIADTGDCVPVVCGHTQDATPEAQQPEILGWADHFRLDSLGQKNPRKAIVARFRFTREGWEKAKKFPRRSVELWRDNLIIDPIALLGATTPRRDLGLLFSKSGRLERYEAKFDEGKHPRAGDGKFGSGGHQAEDNPDKGPDKAPEGKAPDKPSDTPAKGLKAAVARVKASVVNKIPAPVRKAAQQFAAFQMKKYNSAFGEKGAKRLLAAAGLMAAVPLPGAAPVGFALVEGAYWAVRGGKGLGLLKAAKTEASHEDEIDAVLAIVREWYAEQGLEPPAYSAEQAKEALQEIESENLDNDGPSEDTMDNSAEDTAKVVLEMLMNTPEMKFVQQQMKDGEKAKLAEDEPEKLDEADAVDDPNEKDKDKDTVHVHMQLKGQVERFQKENAALHQQMEQVVAKLRRADREKDLVRLEAEGVTFDLAEELDYVTDLVPEKYAKHIDRMRNRYQRAPVGVSFTPARIADSGGPAEFTKGQMEQAVSLATTGKMTYHEALDAIKNHRV